MQVVFVALPAHLGAFLFAGAGLGRAEHIN